MDGTAFGRYRLIEMLGRGGMGEVCRAHDTATNDRTVAIKLVPPQLAAENSAECRTKFARILQDVRCKICHDRPQRPVAAKNSGHYKSIGLNGGHDD